MNLPKPNIRIPYGNVSSSIGELAVFSLSFRDWQQLYKDFATPLDKLTPIEFIKGLIHYVCFPADKLLEGRYKPDKPLLENDTIASLSADDLNAIAKLYIENNNYLFKRLAFRTSRNEKGELISTQEYGEIEHPKEEHEDYVSYLLRLSINDERKQKERFKEIATGFSNFSSVLGNSIKSTLAWGDSLKKTIENTRPSSIASYVSPEFSIPKIDWTEIEKQREANRLRPFNNLAAKLDQLIDTSTQATEFTIEANELQAKIANEIKSSSDETSKFSRTNIRLNGVVIFLTIAGIAIALYTQWKATADGIELRNEIQSNVNLIAGRLGDINNNISLTNDSLKAENERLKWMSLKQDKELETLKNHFLHQQTKLKDLENRLAKEKTRN